MSLINRTKDLNQTNVIPIKMKGFLNVEISIYSRAGFFIYFFIKRFFSNIFEKK